MSERVAVLGAGSWGTALARLLCANGCSVVLWDRSAERVSEISAWRENRHYLPGVKLPLELNLTSDLALCLKDARAVVLAVPSHAVGELLAAAKGFLLPEMLVISAAKGLEAGTKRRVTQIIAESLPGFNQVAVLAGPSHAEEVGRDFPTAVVAAAESRQVAESVQDLFMGPNFRVYTNSDVVGVELGGALKNVIALATGIADGLGFGDNTRAALMTRGMGEIVRLGQKLGAQPATFWGLTGIGDLFVTCTSMYSRNRRAGIQIGQGKPLEKVLREMGMVVEGVRTSQAAMELAAELDEELPICREVYRILFEGQSPPEGVRHLMERPRTHEVEKNF